VEQSNACGNCGEICACWYGPQGRIPETCLTPCRIRATIVITRVSWSPDSKYLYAAVAESDSDVVLLKGLLP
jgi:hypothetical protein